MKHQLKISFDFDSTLAEDRIQKLAKLFISQGHDIWITTTRPHIFPNGTKLENRDLWHVVSNLNINPDNVTFTGGTDKYHFLKGFDMHFDDDQIEIELIEEHLPEVCTILIFDP